jgi:hypothetical protein
LKLKILVTALLLTSLTVHAQVQSPAEFLGYELGEHFTPHHKVMAYFNHVADQSGMVSSQKYGETYERRELMLYFVSTEENHSRLDDIRLNNLRRTGMEDGAVSADDPAVVWLSYNVHGNETSSSEAAMQTIWELVRLDRQDTKTWLQNVIVVMDPMINPDGRDRYVNWYNTTVGKQMNAFLESREHNEPWPGGRINHYYFDLNRDWAWQSQIESEQRINVYHDWMPQIHVDFHEQGYNDDYYFAPAAKPYHNVISQWQRDFQVTIGKNHAKYFDRESWLYFTGEVFDLFYPSYGDTWPTYNGAIGMTYEQAGHSLAGLGVIKAEGDTLTLLDRLTHHTTAGLSTIEVTSENHGQVVSEFMRYFDEVRKNGSGTYKSYIIPQTANKDKTTALLNLLDKQKITYGRASRDRSVSVFDYSTGENSKQTIRAGDIVIDTRQPKGNMARVLLEPNPELADSLTYDITAWSLFYAYGIDGYATVEEIPVSEEAVSIDSQKPPQTGDDVYAYAMEWKSAASLQFLAHLLKNGVQVRYAEQAFSIEGKNFDAGTLIITRYGNQKLGNEFHQQIAEAAALVKDSPVHALRTGFTDSGQDFGSDGVKLIDTPKIVIASGEGTSAKDLGFIWHYFDQQIDYPVSLVNMDDLPSLNWPDYNVLILPSGSYGSVFDGDALSTLKDWIRNGGKLIAVGGANRYFAGKSDFELKYKEKGENGEDTEDFVRYEDRNKEAISSFNPGSIYEVETDNSHPLAFGFDDVYFSLKTSSTAYDYLENGWNVGRLTSASPRAGFTGYKARKALQNSLAFGVQNMGAGEVVYLIDQPVYRAFWENGKLLLGNAVFLVGQ